MNESSGQTGNDKETAEGNEKEQESSSSTIRMEDTLTNFRERWQRELDTSPKREAPAQQLIPIHSTDDSQDELSVEIQARNLFLKGAEYEQNGELYEAIRFYKRAVQLVPDIEFRIYESTKSKDKFDDAETLQTLDDHDGDAFECDNDIKDDEEDCDLFTKLSKAVDRNHCLCFPKFDQSGLHVSALPMEIVLYILRWIVSSELDLRSLESFSTVCRGFFISARDPEIWRLACIKIWGVNCGHYKPKYNSWRAMFIERPRLRYDGCYISKHTYIRHGERSFQDEFYRPWHLVEYFRYLRFFPEGRVLMLTSSDEAQGCVNALKHRNPRNLSALIGHYRLRDESVTLVMKKQENKSTINMLQRKKRREVVHDSGEQTFRLEFEIQNHHKRANSKLNWICYNIFTQYKNGQEGTMCLNVCGRYPPFKFSRVKSYTQESDAPLQ